MVVFGVALSFEEKLNGTKMGAVGWSVGLTFRSGFVAVFGCVGVVFSAGFVGAVDVVFVAGLGGAGCC